MTVDLPADAPRSELRAAALAALDASGGAEWETTDGDMEVSSEQLVAFADGPPPRRAPTEQGVYVVEPEAVSGETGERAEWVRRIITAQGKRLIGEVDGYGWRTLTRLADEVVLLPVMIAGSTRLTARQQQVRDYAAQLGTPVRTLTPTDVKFERAWEGL